MNEEFPAGTLVALKVRLISRQISSIMIKFAFDNLLSRFDELTVIEPKSFEELSDIYFEFKNILCELEELLRIIGSVANLSED